METGGFFSAFVCIYFTRISGRLSMPFLLFFIHRLDSARIWGYRYEI